MTAADAVWRLAEDIAIGVAGGLLVGLVLALMAGALSWLCQTAGKGRS